MRAKGSLERIRKSHSKLSFVVAADSLYSKQAHHRGDDRSRMNYVLTAKPEDHKKLMEWVNEMRMLEETRRLSVKDGEHVHIYEWINDVPLNDSKKTVMVNYIEYWMQKGGETTYHNSWVSDIVVHENNVQRTREDREMPLGKSRTRPSNSLKNQGITSSTISATAKNTFPSTSSF